MDGIEHPYILVYFKNSINKILQEPLVHTQRIKYTSFDVSNSFIILGASSGGLYVFRREPCVFLQIIPNQDGAVEHISISSNEKYIAFSTAKKSFCILQFNNNIDESNKNTLISSKTIFRENFPAQITYLKWNLYNTEIYFGDSVGQISVVDLKDFLAKTMFQSPCYPLMRLDSEIVQLDWNSNLILASTLTRCYVCDTEREEYRQGGQKLRDGQFGACFVNRNESDTSISVQTTERRKNAWSIAESSTRTYYQNVKIYSARPGARIWEIQVDGTVLKTLQYKEVCANAQSSEIIPHDPDPLLRLEVYRQDNGFWSTIGINFGKLFVIKKQYLLTFHRNVLFVLDPNLTQILTSYNSNADIVDLSVIGSIIYLYHNGGSITILYLTEIEKFLLRTFINKQYLFCADMCIHYMQYLIQLVPKSNRLYLISRLCDKLVDHKDLLPQLEPLMSKIREDISSRQTSSLICNNGVKVVENAFVEDLEERGRFKPVPVQKELMGTVSDTVANAFKQQWGRIEEKLFMGIDVGKEETGDSSKVLKMDEDTPPLIIERPKEPVNPLPSPDPIVYVPPQKPKKSEPTTEIKPTIDLNVTLTPVDPHIDVAYQYYKLSKISKIYNCRALDDVILTYASINFLYDFTKRLFTHTVQAETEPDEDMIKLWCANIFLRFIELKTTKEKLNGAVKEILQVDGLKQYLIEAFVDLNFSSELGCSGCGFPLPSTALFGGSIKYYEIGEVLVQVLYERNIEDAINICKKVPYMWREVIKSGKKCDPVPFIPLLIQFNDMILIEMFLYSFDSTETRDLIENFVKLQDSLCLNCKSNIVTNQMCNWTQLSLLLLKVFGATVTLELLRNNAHLIPKGALDPKFYQICLIAETKEQFVEFEKLSKSNPQMLMQTVESLLVMGFHKNSGPGSTKLPK